MNGQVGDRTFGERRCTRIGRIGAGIMDIAVAVGLKNGVIGGESGSNRGIILLCFVMLVPIHGARDILAFAALILALSGNQT